MRQATQRSFVVLSLLAAIALSISGVALAGPEGSWESDYGDMVIFGAPSGGVIATYRSDGTIYGSLQGNRLVGRWSQFDAREDCGSALGGNRFWGDVVLVFNEDFTAFTGEWNRCGGATVANWKGWRGAPATTADPIIDPILEKVEIVAAESDRVLDAIAVGESFRVKLTYSEAPAEIITRKITISTSRGISRDIEVTGDSQVVLSPPIAVVPLVEP